MLARGLPPGQTHLYARTPAQIQETGNGLEAREPDSAMKNPLTRNSADVRSESAWPCRVAPLAYRKSTGNSADVKVMTD
jgi:hypothetical protein